MNQHTPGPWSYASTRDESTYALFDSNDKCRLMFLVGGIKSTHDQIMEQHRQNETDARRIVKCVNAMDGISDDNALFFPGNSVRSVISTMELKRMELEQQRDELQADRDNWRNEARGLRESQERLWKQRDLLLAALEALKLSATKVGNVAYNLGQSDEQWDSSIRPATQMNDQALITAGQAISAIKFDTELHGKTIAELKCDGHLGGAA